MAFAIVFFLLDVRYIYTEVHDKNLRFVAFCFLMGIVALNRLIAWEGMKEGFIYFLGLAGAVIMWFLSNFPWYPDVANSRNGEMKRMELSYAGRIGKAIMPVFHPSGIHDWRLGVGFVGGFFAKEIVVTTLGTLYTAGAGGRLRQSGCDGWKGEHNLSLRQSLRNAVRQDGTPIYTPLIAFSVMVFFLLYLPCISTVSIIRRETNSWRWPVFAILYTIAVAWVASFLIYQGGKLFGLK
ncbi:MAG: hypothetical protein NT106_06865, partial [Candidatus Sumerlaeota bacterium]|nr:hypothetical protein [Candidatus Sumerlaeota bacterium]